MYSLNITFFLDDSTEIDFDYSEAYQKSEFVKTLYLTVSGFITNINKSACNSCWKIIWLHLKIDIKNNV